MISNLVGCSSLLLWRTAGTVNSRLIGRHWYDPLMAEMIQLVELWWWRLLHRILVVGLQLLMVRLVDRMRRLVVRRGESRHRERNKQHRTAEDVRTTSTHCARLLPTPLFRSFLVFVANTSRTLRRTILLRRATFKHVFIFSL